MSYRKIKDLDNKKQQQLADLIHMKSPYWMNPKSAKLTLQKWDESKTEVLKDLKGILNIHYSINFLNGPSPHPEWNSVEGFVQASQYLDLWKNNRIISTSDAQDAKDLTQKTFEDAQNHATHHWNNKWIDAGHLNIEKWFLSDNSINWVVQPVDFEHRLWGIIGFLLGLVPLGPKAYSWDSIEVAGLFIHEISSKTGKSIQEVESKFNTSYHKCVMLPMMDKEIKSEYFRDKNSASVKTDLQLGHSIHSDLNDVIKKHTSVKVHNDNSNNYKLNSFSDSFTNGDKYSLRTYEYGIAIWKLMDNDYKFSDMSKAKLRGFISENVDYSVNTNHEIEYEEIFEILFNATKYGHLEFSLQKAILFIKMLKELKDNDFHVICLKTFSKCFADWITDESWEIKNIDGVDEQVKSRFIVELNKTNTAVQYNDLYKLIKKKFLKFYDVTTLNKIGVVSKPKKLPRYWSNELKNKNIKYWKDKDIDGKTIGTHDNKHAGHLISDFELSRLTDEERKKVFKEESDTLESYGYPPITGHETNFRVISVKHNLRMDIMRMSDYHKILGTTTNENIQAELVSEKIKEYEEKYKNKPILS